MTKESLIEALNNMPDGEEVLIDVNVRGVEFTVGIEEIFESGHIYISTNRVSWSKEEAKRWWGTKEV